MALSQDQIAARKIGGSDIGVILGINPYRTPLDLYHEKIGEAPPFDGNENTQAGEVMEDAIADLYTLRTGVAVRKSNITHKHNIFDYLTAHIDRHAVGVRRIVEIKNVGRNAARQWGEPGIDSAPAWYVAQVHHYMLVRDYTEAEIVAYFGGGDLGIYPVRRSGDWDARIIEAAGEFWHCVQTRTPPKFDPSHPAARDTLLRVYPGTTGETVEGDARLMAWSEVEREAAEKAKEYEQIQDGAKNHILAAMGEAAILKLQNGSSYTRKTIERGSYTVEAGSYVQLRFQKAKS